MKVKIVNKSNNPNPLYATAHAAGMDICAYFNDEFKKREECNVDVTDNKWYIVLKPLERYLVPTGLYIQLPIGAEAQIRPRSGLAIKQGLTVLNTPGTIDADYTGEVKVILINLGNESIIIKEGDRIAQMVIAKHEVAEWINVEALDSTARGEGGFGSTGTSQKPIDVVVEKEPKKAVKQIKLSSTTTLDGSTHHTEN